MEEEVICGPPLEMVNQSNLIVKGLPDNCTDDQIRSLFQPFGQIRKIKIIKNNRLNKRKALAFVNFLRIESALVAMRSLNGLVWEGYHLTVEVVKSKPVMTISTPNKRELFVAKFPRTFSVLDLNTLFTQYGEITKCHIVMDRAGTSQRIAFVEFARSEDADIALERLHGLVLGEGTAKLKVKYALPPRNFEGRNELIPRSEIFQQEYYETLPSPSPHLSQTPLLGNTGMGARPAVTPLHGQRASYASSVPPSSPFPWTTHLLCPPPLPPDHSAVLSPFPTLCSVIVNNMPGGNAALLSLDFFSQYGKVIELLVNVAHSSCRLIIEVFSGHNLRVLLALHGAPVFVVGRECLVEVACFPM